MIISLIRAWRKTLEKWVFRVFCICGLNGFLQRFINKVGLRLLTRANLGLIPRINSLELSGLRSNVF